MGECEWHLQCYLQVTAAKIMDIPVIATEQYPKGTQLSVLCLVPSCTVHTYAHPPLPSTPPPPPATTFSFPPSPSILLHTGLGNTVSEIDVSSARVFPKTVFSMAIPEVEEVLKQDANRKSVVLFGIEVCYK